MLYEIRDRVRLLPVLRYILGGSTVMRSVELDMLRDLKIEGSVIDLASNKPFQTEYQVIDHAGADITFTDYYSAAEGVLKVDLEQKLPFDDRAYDHAFLFYALSVIYGTDQLLQEMNRVVGKGVVMIEVFARQYAPHPNDYFRFTEQALRRKLDEAGFVNIQIHPVRHGPFTLAFSMVELLFHFNWLRAALLSVAWFCDSVVFALGLRRKGIKQRSVLAWIVTAEKA